VTEIAGGKVPRAICFGLLLTLSWVTAASGALAPNFERQRELTAILDNPALAQKLGNRVIQGIEAQGDNTYRVWTADCSVTVTLIDASANPPMPGGRQFTIQVGDPRCH
jgi:hypothetical protein